MWLHPHEDHYAMTLVAPLQTGPNPFIFAYISAEKHPHHRSASPMGQNPQHEALDPQLNVYPTPHKGTSV